MYNKRLFTKKSTKMYNFLLLFVSVLLVVNITFAWFFSDKEKGNIKVFGNLELNVTADLDFSNVALEPDKIYNKQTTIQTLEESIDALLKVKFICDYKVNGTNEYIVVPVLENSAKWVKDGDYYYYIGVLNSTSTVKFNSGLKVSNNITNKDKEKPVKLNLEVYVIQKEYGAYKEHPDWVNAPQAWKTEIEKL